MGGYERQSSPAFLDGTSGFERIPPDFNGRLLEDDWDRFEEIVLGARRRVPQMEDVRVARMINGPEAFTPDNEFCLGETDVRGLFVATGSARTGSRAPVASARSRPSGSMRASPRSTSGAWTCAASARTTAPPPTRSPGCARPMRRTTTSTIPVTSASPGGRCGCRPRMPGTASTARRSVRVWLGAGQLVRAQRRGGRRVVAPARLGGPPLVTRDRSGAPGPAARRLRCSTRLVRQARGRRARGRRPARAAVRERGGARGRPDHLHADAERARRHRGRPDRLAA